MRKDRSVVFQFDHEIERIVRRLRREQKNSKTVSDMDNLQDVGTLDPHGPLQPVNIQEEQNEHVNQRQQGNNNIIYMSNDRDRAIRDYVLLTLQVVYPGIVRPEVEAANFELKPVMFQILQTVGQFNGLPTEDPHIHLKLFLENAKLRNEITSFRELEDESLYEAWERFKELLRRCLHHGIPCCIQLEAFYNGLNPSTRLMVDASANGALLSKSYTEAYEILERIANNNYQWPSTRQPAARGAAGVHNIDAITTLSRQVTSLTNIVKAMTSAPAVVKQIAELTCMYCGEEHEFDNCPRNPASVNYRLVPPEATQQFRHPPHFLQRFQKQKQDKQFSKFLEVLKQLHINIPFVEALEQMPNYVKFLKDILARKRRLREFKIVALTQERSRMLQSRIPKKLKDLGSFTISYSIGTRYNGRALCDLGANINLMPLSVFKQLGVGECRPTIVNLQLTDRFHAYPEGKIEDVLVKVDKFIFPVDFIVLDFEADKEVPITLGRPFLATGKTLIDVQKGELTMRVNDQQVTFNILEAMKNPDEAEDCNFLSVVDFVVVDRIDRCYSK
ncbi:hypothetical protein KPL71_014470 [Citrus sinensis]|uniref:Uncharacterized protein n=1 Tax=Citrus sinensis TaxID=2711 RepID=A0ACB8KBW9_CITSI|nr:hypothetical protein KPL71_014470 [Citrus sinensis]